MAVLGLFGGFLTPVLLSTGVDNPYGLFGYVALLNMGLLAVTLRKRWNFLPPLGAVGTLLLQAGWWNAFYDKGGYATGSGIFIPMAVFALMPALFAGALRIAKRRGNVHEALTGSTLALLGAGFLAGCSFVFAPYLEMSPTVSFAFIFGLEAMLFSAVTADRRFAFAVPVTGMAVFLLLASWMMDALTAASLSRGLTVCFVFGLIHTAVPVVLKKIGRISRVPGWCHAGPVLTLLLAAFAVTRDASPSVWLLLLAVNALALGLAVCTRKALPLGGALILVGLSHTLWISLVLMAFVGFGLTQNAAVSNTIIQSLVPEDRRARVMSYYTMAFFGAAPFGSLLVGALAHRIGAPDTIILTGAACLAGTLWFTLELPKIRAIMRPIYEQMGLLPQ